MSRAYNTHYLIILLATCNRFLIFFVSATFFTCVRKLTTDIPQPEIAGNVAVTAHTDAVFSAGVKEVDIAATLEHLRDQRMNTVETKEQLEFILSAVAEEVQALLKALPQ